MSTNQEIKHILNTIATKKDLLQAIKETSDAIKAQTDLIKEAQEEIKTLLLADEDAVALNEEIKSLSGELKEALKLVAKQLKHDGVEAKPAELKKYYTVLNKGDEKRDAVIQVGSKFNVLKEVL